MKISDIPVVVDSDMPPGTIELRSTTTAAAGVLLQVQIRDDTLLAEELRSISESSPFFIRAETCTEPIQCECYGT